jgi:tetratricopeptide (TPR) repeat protein
MKFFFSFFSIVLVASASLVAQDQAAAITAYNEARELAQAKDYSAAIDKYSEAIEIASQLGEGGEDIKNRSEKQIPKLYFTIAVDAFNEFRSGPSLEKLDATIELFIQSEEIGINSGDTDVQRKSTSVLAQLNYQKGLMLFKREMFVESVEALDEAIRINPNYAKAFYQKALAHKKNSPEDVDGIMGWYDQAIATAIRVNDSEVERLANQSAHGDLLFRGAKAIEAGNNTQAIELLQSSLDYFSESSDSYYRLAEASNKLQRYNDAIQYSSQALGLETGGNTDKAKIYFELGLANQMLENKGEACSAFESASYGSFKQPSEYKMEFELKCKSTRP